MQRTALGTIALILFVAAAGLWILEPSRSSPAAGACVRIGTVLLALWLALPQLAMLPRWMMFLFFGAAAVVCYNPKALLFALPVLVLVAVLRPRLGRPPVGRR
jgi:hypothetical protein